MSCTSRVARRAEAVAARQRIAFKAVVAWPSEAAADPPLPVLAYSGRPNRRMARIGETVARIGETNINFVTIFARVYATSARIGDKLVYSGHFKFESRSLFGPARFCIH